MDRRRGLATSAAVAITIASGAMAIWPGFGLLNGPDTESVGKFRPAVSQATAGPEVVQVGVPAAPGLPTTGASTADEGQAAGLAAPGTTLPEAPAQAGAQPGAGVGKPADDDCLGTAGTTEPPNGVTTTEPGGRQPEYGPCPIQSTRTYGDDYRDD